MGGMELTLCRPFDNFMIYGTLNLSEHKTLCYLTTLTLTTRVLLPAVIFNM